MQKIKQQQICRIIDANSNRAHEGLRVCEDICRFLFNARSITARYKKIRHALSGIVAWSRCSKTARIVSRNTAGDVGKRSITSEFRRTNVEDIFYANSQRVKESVRVLEEFFKLSDTGLAHKIKKLRYTIYALEKDIAKKL